MARVWRAYFNRHREAPQVWSIDEGSQETEVNVIRFECHQGCELVSHYNATPANDDAPSAWLVITAEEMSVRKGVAHFLGRLRDGRP